MRVLMYSISGQGNFKSRHKWGQGEEGLGRIVWRSWRVWIAENVVTTGLTCKFVALELLRGNANEFRYIIIS